MPDSTESGGSHGDAELGRPPPSDTTQPQVEAPARRKAARAGSYDSWTVPELRKRAKELGMTGYSALSKSDLIYELRKI